jgi:hypothetical protein
MRHRHFKLGSVIATATACALVYVLSIMLDLQLAVILALFVISVIATIWMVLRILTDPYSTTKTFDDYFYQDRDDLRPGGKN